MSDLKPCPFCGNTKIKRRSYSDEIEGSTVTLFFCRCSNCESDGSTAYSRVEAEEKWNTRYPTDAD